MPSVSATLDKLHLRRRKSSSSSHGKRSPVSSPTRGAASRNSVDGSSSSPRTGSRTVNRDGGRGSGGYEGSGSGSGRLSTASLNKDLPTPPSGPRREDGPDAGNLSLPRSQAQFALPTIPPTPMDEHDAEKSELAGGRAAATSPPRLPSIRRLSGFGETEQGGAVPMEGITEWTLSADMPPVEASHDLAAPPALFPVTIPSFPFDEDSAHCASLPEGFKPMPLASDLTQQQAQVTTGRPRVNVAPVNPAFVADHRYSIGLPDRHSSATSTAADDQVHQAHLQKHLSLLDPRIFAVKVPTGSKRTSSLAPADRAASTITTASKRAAKVLPLKAGPAVPYEQAERELARQRESLLDDIVRSGRYPRGDASAALEAAGGGKLEIDQRKKVVFDSIGWTDRLGILDTVDVQTRYLEPIIQEHVRPIEHIIYTTLIYREIHRYHIYPYIQPIADPNPKILPTRHLFPDPSIESANGKRAFRVIYGDDAAEAILGRELTKKDTEGRTYYEHWIESVDGIKYEWTEQGSVEVGKRGWVERVGQRSDGDVVEWYARLAGDREGYEMETQRNRVQVDDAVPPSSRPADLTEVSQDDRRTEGYEASSTRLHEEQGDIVHGRAI